MRYVEGLLLCESIVRRAYNRDPFNPKVKDINSISSARSVDCHSLVPGDFMAGKIDFALFISHSLSFRYPSYCGSNIWPHSALPELEVGMLTKYYSIPSLAFKRDLFCLLEIVS
ncbi:hypothetical protein WN943_000816 [Citrus x changshan-huyou]